MPVSDNPVFIDSCSLPSFPFISPLSHYFFFFFFHLFFFFSHCSGPRNLSYLSVQYTTFSIRYPHQITSRNSPKTVFLPIFQFLPQKTSFPYFATSTRPISCFHHMPMQSTAFIFLSGSDKCVSKDTLQKVYCYLHGDKSRAVRHTS